MKYFPFFTILLFLSLAFAAQSQTEDSNTDFTVIKPPSESIVQQHKETLQLTLIVDSIIIGQKTIIPGFKTTIPISFESDYIHVTDDLYLKIFIARNQEYGSKFYSWKWDFLKKKKGKFHSMGVGGYQMMDYNGSLDTDTIQGLGVGGEGTADFIMYYYRYKLQ